MSDDAIQADDCAGLFEDIKHRIRSAQIRAAVAVNTELILLYWSIGRDIIIRQGQQGCGTGVVDRLAEDLRRHLSDLKYFTPNELEQMRAFAEAWPDEKTVQELLVRLPWGHNLRLLQRVEDAAEREWYARAALENSWPRLKMVKQIESGLYQRQGEARPASQPASPEDSFRFAEEMLTNHVSYDFLMLFPRYEERNQKLWFDEQIRDILMRSGVGFALIGSPFWIDVRGEDFLLDMLFYHVRLHRFVVVDINIGECEPEDAGRMGFYLATVDELLCHPDEQPSIGILLFSTERGVIAQYARRDVEDPQGATIYRSHEALPDDLSGIQTSIEDLVAGLDSRHFGYDTD